jgi:hypothetical protein
MILREIERLAEISITMPEGQQLPYIDNMAVSNGEQNNG